MLTPRDVTGILRLGGTILGTAEPRQSVRRSGRPPPTARAHYSDRVFEMFQQDGPRRAGRRSAATARSASPTSSASCGIPIVGVPKTIDNDIVGTTNCFGFDTAVDFATDAIDRLHTTAEAHQRIMVVEVMGRYAGWIALYAGVAGGADAILIPEIPFDIASSPQRLRERDEWGAKFSIVVVAEGAFPKGGTLVADRSRARPAYAERLGGIGAQVCEALAGETGKETRSRRARSPAARRRADQLRPDAGDALRRQGGRAGQARRVRHDGRLRPARHRGATPRRGRGEDQDRAAWTPTCC